MNQFTDITDYTMTFRNQLRSTGLNDKYFNVSTTRDRSDDPSYSEQKVYH